MVCCMCIYRLCFRPFSPDGGTLAPFFLASERPMAMACLRLFTFFPLRPLFSSPRFILCIASFTCSWDQRSKAETVNTHATNHSSHDERSSGACGERLPARGRIDHAGQERSQAAAGNGGRSGRSG